MKIWIIVGAAVGALLLLWVGWGTYVIVTTERPAYEVLRRFEADRQFHPHFHTISVRVGALCQPGLPCSTSKFVLA